MRHHAETDENYFINENLKKINDIIKELETRETDYKTPLRFYKMDHYTKQGAENYKTFKSCYWHDFEARENYYKNYGFKELNENEIKSILEGYKLVKKDFEKRLTTYLKKYGLSKLHCWTYWADE